VSLGQCFPRLLKNVVSPCSWVVEAQEKCCSSLLDFHVERMAEDNLVQKIKRWKPMSKRPIGRPETRWEVDVLEDIKSINIRNWMKVAQNRDSWKKVVQQARTLYRL